MFLSKPRFHPAAKMIVWLLLAIMSVYLSSRLVLLLFFVLLMLNLALGRRAIWNRLWRMRWLWLGIVALYGLSQPLWFVWLGWQDGMIQALRVIALMLLFALLAGGAQRDESLAGVYFLLKPFRLLHMPVETGVLRVGMAVQYIEAMDGLKWQDLGQLNKVLADLPELPSRVTLELPEWSSQDTLLVIMGFMLGGWML